MTLWFLPTLGLPVVGKPRIQVFQVEILQFTSISIKTVPSGESRLTQLYEHTATIKVRHIVKLARNV
jgi:hypothetical protein